MASVDSKPPRDFIPGLAGVPAVESSISDIDGNLGLLAYRGIPIEDLARNSTYEETSYLLIKGRLPTRSELGGWTERLRQGARLDPGVHDVLRALPRDGHPMKALQAGTVALGMFRPEEESRADSTIRIIAGLPSLVAAFHRIRSGETPVEPRGDMDLAAGFLWMLSREEPDPVAARTMDICLILHAEHTINASTFSALVTASTLADPYSVVTSALGTLAGELHGGANERVLAMLREIGSIGAVPAYLDRMLADGKRVMGVGHRVYKTKDPRAYILQGLAEKLFERLGTSGVYEIALEVERVVSERLQNRGIYPNVDFYSGVVYDALGIRSDLFTPIFAISRSAGWLGHWLEQTSDNKLFRPTQIYRGERERAWIPIEERG